MRIYALVGMPGAGKSEATEILKDMKIPVIVMGDVIREEMKKRGIDITRENMGKFTREIREQEGWDVVARKCLEKINHLNADIIMIDGVRNPEEIDYFREHLSDFKIIHVHASPEIRFQRLKTRGRKDDPLTLEDFKKRDERELSFGIQKIIEQADFTVKNEKTKEDLKEQILKIIS
ncbi:MAG: AAA family ATPase [Candidatus Helarchaeales archaeon]